MEHRGCGSTSDTAWALRSTLRHSSEQTLALRSALDSMTAYKTALASPCVHVPQTLHQIAHTWKTINLRTSALEHQLLSFSH